MDFEQEVLKMKREQVEQEHKFKLQKANFKIQEQFLKVATTVLVHQINAPLYAFISELKADKNGDTLG